MKQIDGYPNYFVTEDGRVWSEDSQIFLKPRIDRYGYVQITLSKNSKHRTFTAHRLVATAYIPNPKNKLQVNHIDSNRQNNKLENLEWCTQSENRKHAFDFGSAVISENCKAAVRKRLNKPIVDTSSGTHYNSVSEAAKILNINRVTLTQRLIRQRNTRFIYA